ncbi:MAG TPA: Nif11-like leader peptide family RiPP precursor, partial [Pirellula sp.]|nr:Nif11-like leader peptide family RiPP precursor [Pirellula sp.]
KNDTSLQEKLKGAKTANDAAAIAKAAGWDVTGAELVRHNAKTTSELSEAELDAMAGGQNRSTCNDISWNYNSFVGGCKR